MNAVMLVAGRRSRPAIRWGDTLSWPVLAMVGLLLLVARRPEALFAAEFNWEEASAFYVPTFFFDSAHLILEPWGGYLQVIPRIGYELLRPIPVFWAPLAENLLALVSLLAVAAFIASRRMAAVVPSGRLRLLFAALLLLLPAQQDVMGSIMNIQWYGALWLMLVSVATTPDLVPRRWIERVLVGLVAVSGPFSTLLAPVFLLRLRHRRDAQDVWLAIIVVAGGLVQLVFALADGRTAVTEPRPAGMTAVTFVLHSFIVPVLGERITNASAATGAPVVVLFLGGVVLTALIVITFWRTLPMRSLPVGYGAAAVGLAGLAVHGGANVWPPGANERYFLIAAGLTVAVVVAGTIRGQRLAYPLAALLALGLMGDFRLDPYPAQGWATNYRCIGSTAPCTLAVWPRDYDVHWPGGDGTYLLPQHFDP